MREDRVHGIYIYSVKQFLHSLQDPSPYSQSVMVTVLYHICCTGSARPWRSVRLIYCLVITKGKSGEMRLLRSAVFRVADSANRIICDRHVITYYST